MEKPAKVRKQKSCCSPPDGDCRQSPEMMRLINDLARLFHRELRKVCEENGVPSGYRGILFHLAHENGLCQKDLAAKTGLKPSTVSITLEKMEHDGYIRRERDGKDARAVHVFLTEKGMEIDRKNRKKVAELEKRFSSLITDGERTELSGLLLKVIDGYKTLSGDDACECPRSAPHKKTADPKEKPL